jgi:hypothetical protein
LTIEPSGAMTVTGSSTPWFQRMSGARIGSSAVNNAPTSPERVQLMNPGACGEEPVKSNVSSSPAFVIATWISYNRSSCPSCSRKSRARKIPSGRARSRARSCSSEAAISAFITSKTTFAP